jgi:hypothetical protein
VHGLVINVPGSASSSACAGLDNRWPQNLGSFRSCSLADCALGSCVANSAMRSDYPMLYSLSYDRPVITHQSRDTRSGKSAFGPTRGGWLLTIIGKNFGNYADGTINLSIIYNFLSFRFTDKSVSWCAVINVSVSSSVFNNVLKSDTFGKYLQGKAVCRIPCTPGSSADGVRQTFQDQYQCDGNTYFSGTGNRFVSDTHIVCIAPAGVGISQALTVAVGSTQVDGPSPVPNARKETAAGQINNYGATYTAAPFTKGGPIRVESALALLGPGSCSDVNVTQCTSKLDCGSKGTCSGSASVFIGTAVPPPSDLSKLEAVGIISADYDTNTLIVAPGSLEFAKSELVAVVRSPGINIGPLDGKLDQMQYAFSMFSYERPTISVASPKLGAVMQTRQITIDGLNFGLQTRYVEVRVQGIPYQLHPFGDAVVHHEHVCCTCYWECAGSPRICGCTPPKQTPISGSCVALSPSGICTMHLVDVCKVFTVHEQLQTSVPNIYSHYNQGLLPVHGTIPKQTINPSLGDKQFQLCVIQDPWCPLSTTQDTYIDWYLTVNCPTMVRPETQLVTEYKGVSGTDPNQFYTVLLKESLSVKPECDDVLKVCCSFTLSFKDYFSSLPNYNVYDKFHKFPGFCGQHVIRALIDGQDSFGRGKQKENMNSQSLIYYDDKPVSALFGADFLCAARYR